MGSAELALLITSLEDHRQEVEVVVDAAVYSCCGRGWTARTGYEQTYRGYVANVDLPSGDEAGGARLISRGIGTVSYFVVFGFEHVIDVRGV